MAKRESRHGRIPDGWTKQGLQLPKRVADEFKHHAESFGGGGVKFLGTVAIDLVNRMPEDVRQQLASIAYKTTWPDPNEHEPDDVWSVFRSHIWALVEERQDSAIAREEFFEIYTEDGYDNLVMEAMQIEASRPEYLKDGDSPMMEILRKIRDRGRLPLRKRRTRQKPESSPDATPS